MRKLLLIISIILATMSVSAETISQKQASSLAHLFFNEAAGRVTAPPKLAYNGKRLTTGRLFTPFYVYNSPVGGFVIVSADNKAVPILGYSLKDNFDPERLGETETAFLKSYAREIEYIRYDSQPVEETAQMWQNYIDYIIGILNSRYIATDPKVSLLEADKLLGEAIEKDDAIYAELYTPDQWMSMIADELFLKEVVPLGIIGNNEVHPAVVYGCQGDYFRIEMTERNSWLMRLNATQVVPANMVSVVYNPLELPNEFEEEKPFEIHDLFVEEVNDIEEKRMAIPSIERQIIEQEPLIRANGGGHFEITFPEKINLARLYNLSGSLIRILKFGETSVANLDISSEPSGFYFVTIIGETGKPYGFKLFR